jgi:hypothetical protein
MPREKSSLDDWVSFDRLAEEYPSFPIQTLRYLARAEVRKENGFDRCIRFVTSRKAVVSPSRLAEWIEGRRRP